MKKERVLKDFLSCLKDNDVVVFANEGLSKEAAKNDKEGYFYLDGVHGIAPSLALGIAMSTDKRVFVIDGDGGCMMEMSSLAQIGASKLKNIFYIILDDGCYKSAGGHPTIFREVSSMNGVMLGLGFTSFNLTEYFKKKSSLKKLRKIIDNLRGPNAIFVKVDKSKSKSRVNLGADKKKMRSRISRFIRNTELGTSLFRPPAVVETLDLEEWRL